MAVSRRVQRYKLTLLRGRQEAEGRITASTSNMSTPPVVWGCSVDAQRDRDRVPAVSFLIGQFFDNEVFEEDKLRYQM